MRCWKCKSEMPEGLKYCGNCGVHMNRAVHMFQWLFSKKGLPVLIVVLALILGAAAWYIIPKIRVPAIEIDLDMGWYTPNEQNIVYEGDNKSYGYVNNMILVFFTKDATDEQINEVINSVDGELLGVLPGVRQFQIQVPARTMEELEELRKQLMEFDVVKNATIDYVATAGGETAAVPNDPWNDPMGYGLSNSWDESNPDGTNWWIEASHVLSAWEYQDFFSNLKVGIVDSGFDPNHEDLDLVLLNPEHNDSSEHGTHVAGIIGATANNGVGITGVLQNTTMYCVDCQANDAQNAANISVSGMYGAIDMCVMNGCRVVNLSRGLRFNSISENEPAAERTSRSALEMLIMMIDCYEEDFIVVKSAGNAAVHSRYSGYFAAITEELVDEVLTQMYADGVKFEKEITTEDVMNSFMVVGAVDYARTGGQYQLAEFSNYGDLLTVCAPGCMILSSVPEGNAYNYLQGTSMATPIVTGVAAMVWSIDPEMSAGEVKDLLVSTATEPVLPRNFGDNGSYYMINARAAVEKALQIAVEKATEPTEGSEPVMSGTDDALLPSFMYYVESYKLEQSSLVTDGATGEKYYWDVGSVSSADAPLVDSYLELLKAPEYQLQLIHQDNGEYFYRYTGTADLDKLTKQDGMSRKMEDCHLWIRLRESGDSIRFDCWCSAQFDLVKVEPSGNSEPYTGEPDILITATESDVKINEYAFYFDSQDRIIQIVNTFFNPDGTKGVEEIKGFFYDENGWLVEYYDTGLSETIAYAYDADGRLLSETKTGSTESHCEYYYDATGESTGYRTTYSDRTETAVYTETADGGIEVTMTTEYFDGREPVVDSWIWSYNNDDGLTSQVVTYHELGTTVSNIDRSFDLFSLRTIEDSSGLSYSYLEVEWSLGTSYSAVLWELYLKECNLSAESGRVVHITDRGYDRRFQFAYVR